MYEELERLGTRPLEPHELDTAKTRLCTHFWRELRPQAGKAEALGHYETTVGDYRKLFAVADGYTAVTAADVERVVRSLPATRAAHRGRRGAEREGARERAARSRARRDRIVLVEENHDLPLVRLQVALRAGAGDDAPAEDGLANFASELMGRGAGGRTPRRARRGVRRARHQPRRRHRLRRRHLRGRGARGEAGAGAGRSSPTCSCARTFPAARPTSSSASWTPSSTSCATTTARWRAATSRTRSTARIPTAAPSSAPSASIAALSLEGARAWHERALVGAQVIFGVAGDVDAGEAAAAIARQLRGAARGRRRRAGRATAACAPQAACTCTIVDKPERTQSQILMGQPAPRWHDPDFLALQVATTAFGGTFTARLMDEVRSKRGLSYGASARVGQGRGAKALVAHVFPSLEQTPETLELVLGLWRQWVEDGVTEDEVAFARGYLAKSFAFSVATPEDRLELRAALELAGMPRDFADTFAARVAKVERADAVRALAAHLSPRDLEIAIVSTADELLPKLKAAGLLEGVAVDVVPYDSY